MYQQNVLTPRNYNRPQAKEHHHQQNRKRTAMVENQNEMPPKRWDANQVVPNPYVDVYQPQKQSQQHFPPGVENQHFYQNMQQPQSNNPQLPPPVAPKMMRGNFVEEQMKKVRALPMIPMPPMNQMHTMTPMHTLPPMIQMHPMAKMPPMPPMNQPTQNAGPHNGMRAPVNTVTPPNFHNMSNTSSNNNTSLGVCSTLSSTPEVRNISLNSTNSNSNDSPSQVGIVAKLPGENKSNPCYVYDYVVLSTVGGRLTMVGNWKKYELTVDELRRRVGYPEYMNSSVLATLFRKAKKKNGTAEMRQMLSRYEINLKPCQRQGVVHTSFTLLLEEEAAVFATDNDILAHNYFPKRVMAHNVLMKTAYSYSASHMTLLIEGFLRTMQRISVHAVRVKPKTVRNPEKMCSDQKMNVAMSRISMRTHGFAMTNQMTAIREFFEMGKCALDEALQQVAHQQFQQSGWQQQQWQQGGQLQVF